MFVTWPLGTVFFFKKNPPELINIEKQQTIKKYSVAAQVY